MRRILLLSLFFVSATFLLLLHVARGAKPLQPAASAASPEIQKLAKALAGDWDTTERMEPSRFFPNGGSRKGIAHVRLVAGGAALMDEVDSDGSAGPLHGLVVVWWDEPANTYRFFTCFNDPSSPCEQRSTAHWEGNVFVNDYEELVDGKMTKWRDSFINITPNSHSLVAAMDTGDGTWRTLITTTSTRR